MIIYLYEIITKINYRGIIVVNTPLDAMNPESASTREIRSLLKTVLEAPGITSMSPQESRLMMWAKFAISPLQDQIKMLSGAASVALIAESVGALNYAQSTAALSSALPIGFLAFTYIASLTGEFGHAMTTNKSLVARMLFLTDISELAIQAKNLTLKNSRQAQKSIERTVHALSEFGDDALDIFKKRVENTIGILDNVIEYLSEETRMLAKRVTTLCRHFIDAISLQRKSKVSPSIHQKEAHGTEPK